MARKIKANVLEAIGGTPLVKLLKLPGRRSANVFAKVESLNPGGSVKDRIAWSMVLDAERKGLLAGGGTIVEEHQRADDFIAPLNRVAEALLQLVKIRQ